MPKYQVGQVIQERCTSCYHHEKKVIKVVPKEFEDKMAYVVWTQCPECGTNDHKLIPNDS
ncbi:hypothetical protein SAMN05192559_10364 [Halobacillus karajensis]|uniref:Uncharacterized protein n=1 Tax=Halobacillus karajensis TaxID=195088 RepID=A0A024P4D9_9BACI|nr:hypothetical protein [Halobacillus karajensis]CDQ19992.1 hypothetical protein BN982_02299 [Halobacillus karajensis]CDQ22452.1 hypothetical protein BN983_00660 [Halobacillus karajensis]CDQ28295.1 hypothetical protein BN981_02589 [Halobacillus karajensis]SEH68540.1 hypothetical protein SAMN05192559_10364 [Halobacillus karajensis]